MKLSDRIAGAIWGAFVADSLSLGVHWIYNPRHIARKAGRLTGPIAPIKGADKYHPHRTAGQFTHYGDQMLVLLQSVHKAGRWSRTDFSQRWKKMWDGYDGYIDKATKATLKEGQSGSDDLSGCARMAPLLLALGNGPESDFVTAAREQTLLTHGADVQPEASDFFARLLFATVHGQPVDKAIAAARGQAADPAQIDGWIAEAQGRLQDENPAQVVADLGAHCHIPGAVSATLYLLFKFGHSLEEALVENAMAGGDSAARGLLLGAILGGRDGREAIPDAWIEALDAGSEIASLLGQSSGPPAGRSRFTFTNAEGLTLDGALEAPRENPRGYAVFAHCFTCGKDIAAASRIARALAQHGVAVLRFDFTGLGNSDGDFANTHFSSNVSDLVAAAAALRDQYEAPTLLIGHSLGGAAVLAAAEDIPEVKGVVTIGAPSEPEHVTRLLAGSVEEIESDGQAQVNLAGRTFTIRREFLEDIEGHSLAEKIGRLRRSLLIMHSPIDKIVGIDNAGQIFTAAKHPKSFISLDQADHLLSNKRDSEFVAAVIAAWAERLLGSPA